MGYFNVHSKTNIAQLNLPHGTTSCIYMPPESSFASTPFAKKIIADPGKFTAGCYLHCMAFAVLKNFQIRVCFSHSRPSPFLFIS